MKPTIASLKRAIATTDRWFVASDKKRIQAEKERDALKADNDRLRSASSAYLASIAKEWPTPERAALVAAVGKVTNE